MILRAPDGQRVELNPEAVIGRMASARLRINDPAISEAHALVSLRGSQLKLLSLRGRFTVDGVPAAEATLSRGQVIELGPRVRLEVEEVSVPSHVHAIRAMDLPLCALPPVASISVSGVLEPGFLREAAATLWIDGEMVWLRRPQGEDERLHLGEAFDAAGQTFVLERMQVGEAGMRATASSFDAPLTLRLFYDSVQIICAGRTSSIDGIPARILCELGAIRAPVEWRTVAREIWPRESDDTLLRRNWDAGLSRLRRALFEGGVRGDLVRAAGRGRVGLFLGARDRIVDRQ